MHLLPFWAFVTSCRVNFFHVALYMYVSVHSSMLSPYYGSTLQMETACCSYTIVTRRSDLRDRCLTLGMLF